MAAYQLQILHFYGESGTLGVETAPILGAMVDKFRLEASNTIVLAEGDTWIPGPWLVGGADPSLSAVPGIGATALARPDVAILNALGTTASALGNHEFDLGSPVVQGATAASGAWVGAQFPFITSNLNFAADSSLRGLADASLGGTATNNFAGLETSAIKGKIAPYAITTVNGERIGIVGATTYDLLTKTSPNGTVPKDDANPSTSDLQEVAAYIQVTVDALRASGINKIVMVDQLDTIERNRQLAPLVSGVDVMVAGGGHERIGDATDVAVAFNGHDASFVDTYPIVVAGADAAPVLIVTTDTEFSYLGRLQVTFDDNGIIDTSLLNPAVNGAYAANEATLQTVYATANTADQIVASSTTGSKIAAIANATDAVVTAKDGTKFGFSNVYLEGDRVFGRAQETNLGNLTADANAYAARKALPSGTQVVVSLKNGGGLRASIGSIDEDGAKIANAVAPGAAGNVSQLDVENALRFDNKLMVFDTTAQGLLNILNYAAGLSPGNGGFPQLGGLRFSYDTTQPAGARVRNVALYDLDGNFVATVVKDGAVAPGAPGLIQVICLNFTTNGGDGYPIKANASNFRYLLNDGTLSAAVSPTLDFTAAANVPSNAMGEQVTFETYMSEVHGTAATAFAAADTPASGDLRIENLGVRTDAVLAGAKPLMSAGDVDQDSAVLLAKAGNTGAVRFEVSTKADFSDVIVNQTVTVAEALVPAKLDLADGTLAAGTRYYWRATDAAGAMDTASFVTANAVGTFAGLRFGVSGDWRQELAPYPALSNVAAAGLDVFVKLGDTIYADYPSPDLNQAQAVSRTDYLIKQLEGYSGRAGLNTLNDLQKTTAIIAQIDDHEVINDFSGGATVQLGEEGIYGAAIGTRINDTPLYDNGLGAFQAYNAIEARTYAASADARTSGEIDLYRKQTYGSDGVLFSLDARSFRDAEIAGWNGTTPDAGRFLAESFTPGRTMLGSTQLARLKADLLESQASGVRWKFVALPEPMQNFGPAAAQDRYEGYAAERTELLKFIDDNDIENVVFVAADVHGTVVNNLTYQVPGAGGLGAQIALPSFEITTGAVAFDAPFGPTVVDLAASLGFLSAGDVATYNALPAAAKEAFFTSVVNAQLDPFGYDRVGLTDNLTQAKGLLSATLDKGAWTATNSFGWTDFKVDATSGDLTVTTWGIAPYTEAEATAASVVARTPTVQSQFTVKASSAVEFSLTSASNSSLASLDYTNAAVAGLQSSSGLTDTTGADIARFRAAGGDVAITGATFADKTTLAGAIASLAWSGAGALTLANDGKGGEAKQLSVTDFTGPALTLTNWSNLAVSLSGAQAQSLTVLNGDHGSITTGAGADRIETALPTGPATATAGFTIAAGAGNDTVIAGAANDTLEGGLGDDSLDGGDGTDVAVIAASVADARVVLQTDGSWNVSTLGGTDNLKSIEQIRFTDGTFHLASIGPSTTQTPYLVGSQPNVRFVSLLSAGDQVGFKSDKSTPWVFAGIPDGIGAFNNGNGTATVLVNHELGTSAGAVREHGAKGGFVDKLTIDIATLKVTAAEDLGRTVMLWDPTANAGAGGYVTATANAFARLCSADLASSTALYDAATGRGTLDRIFFNGEETGAEGRAFAWVVTGTEAGTVYELPRLGNTSYENVTLAPHAGVKTVAIATDDSTPGQVYVYVGEKKAVGTSIERAGLTNGQLYGIKAEFAAEVSTGQALTGKFTLANLGNVEQQTGAAIETASDTAGVTEWLRPEDGAWDTLNPNRYYFVTTNNFTSPSRLWALDFTDVTNPALGGTYTALLDGTEGQRMFDNITVDSLGRVLMQEDVGNNARSSRTWQYDPATDRLFELARHDTARFGDETTPATAPFNQDEESSGIVDVTAIFGNAAQMAFLVATQAHSATGVSAEVVENGQLQLMLIDRPVSGGPVGGLGAPGGEGGGAGDDVLRGGTAADSLAGGLGNDQLSGGNGDDFLTGGAGEDTAGFAGARDAYRIGRMGATVVVDGPDGRDTLVDVEALRFGAAAPVFLDALSGVGGLLAINRDGATTYELPDAYSGPLDLAGIFRGTTAGEIVLGGAQNDFISGRGGNDVVIGGGGDDVLDGGTGLNFLVGGTGRDTFFVDGRGFGSGPEPSVQWGIITDFEAGESVTLWGWQDGVSRISFAEDLGAPGYTGGTALVDINGSGTTDVLITWAGRSVADLPTQHVGPTYNWFY